MSEQSRPAPQRPSTLRLGDIQRASESSEQSRTGLRLVQDRLALFGKTIFWIASTFLLLSAVFHVLGVWAFWQPGRGPHLLAAAIALCVWRLARRRKLLHAWLLHALDGLGTVVVCVTLIVMGYLLSHSNPWGFFASTLAVFHVTMARAIIVPSTPLRTLVLSALSFSGLIVSQALLPVPAGPLPQLELGWLILLGPIAWSSTGTALCTLASSVIYGLQEQVQEARQLGQYTLEQRIGEGGMGEVYSARHAMLRRPTAIKLISGSVSAEQLRRFEKEVQLTASLTHPNIVSVYDYGRTPDGTFYYAMELLDGLTLEELVSQHGAQPSARVVHILLQACAALRDAHDSGLIHRDVKPANVFLCRRQSLADLVKVLDFGLVKQIAGTSGDASQTNVNQIVGTPLYMSPEAIVTPDSLDARSDLYALGAVAYFLLTGVPVFSGASVVEVCSSHLHEVPLPPSVRVAQSVDPDLEALVLQCLAKRPEARPASAALLTEQLRRCSSAGSWGEADARAWWAGAAERGTRRPDPERRERRTIRVALNDRGMRA